MVLWGCAAAVFSVVYLVRYCHAVESIQKSIFKAGSMALLAIGAAVSGGPSLLVASLVFATVGDWLISRDRTPNFVGGMVAFALCHITYVILMLVQPEADLARLFTHPAPVITILLIIFGVVVAAQLYTRTGVLRMPVVLYIPVILSLGIFVMALPTTPQFLWAKIGAAIFIVSDFVLSQELFALPDTSRWQKVTPYIVWATYWLAQLCLTIAFVPLV